MHTQHAVTIRGDIGEVYALAATVERWPEILPHYRRVDVIEPGESERVVSMQCVRSFGPLRWPCKWRAKQTLLPDENRILFRHLAGPVRGMEVEWRLRPVEDGIQTTIVHELSSKGPMGVIYSRFVGRVFISAIAGQTLGKIKELVERGYK